MKRKFIFFAMLLLTLIGGVKLNVLNAQETVTIGEGTASIYVAPFCDYYKYSISQQIYTSDKIDTESGMITEIAYQIAQTYGNERNLVVYMTETEKTEYTDNYDWIPVTDDDIVFEGMISTAKDDNGWFVIELQNTFEYNGGNIAVTVYDRTGSTNSSYCKFYAFEMSESWKGLYNTGSYEVDINSLDTKYGTRVSSYVYGTGYIYYLNNIRFTFGEAGEVVPPSVPTNLTATAINHASIELTWYAAENAKKYYVYKDGEYLDETSATNYTVNNLSDGKQYCFTVKSVYNSSNVSEESEQSCATTEVLPIPATPTNLAATSVTHNSATLTWDEVEYAESYTVSYETTEITVTENTCVVTGLTPETPYTFSVKANNIKGSSVATTISVTTLEYNNPFEGKQFRIMVNSGNATGKYLNIFAYNKQSGSYSNYSSVGATAKANSEMQKFVIEDAGNGNYYLKNIAGYYIKCAQWNVDAYSQTEKTALTFEYLEGSDGPFYLRDSEYTDGKTNNYFKVEYSYSGAYYYNYHVYCDQPKDNSLVVTWVLKEVVLTVDATADNNQIYDDQTTTLQANIEGASGDCSYSWTLNGEVVGTEATYTFTPSTTGEYTFTCTVTDSKNATATDNVTVNVNARPALAISSITAEKELIYNNDETTTLTANATNGYAPYTYSWTLNEEVVGTNATYTFSNKTVGEYTLTCTVKDSRNNTATASKTITVKDISEKPSEIEIGTNEMYDKYMPTHAYYGNSYTQQIYTAAEIGIDGGTITEIAFMKYNSNTADRKIKVFMLNTTKESFVSTSNWVTVGDNDLVFDGTCNFSGNAGEWTKITLTNEFNYTGGNILLCVSDYTNSWVNPYPQFYVYEGDPSNRSLYTYQDDTPYGDNCSQSGTRRSVLNHIKFNYKPAAPKAPKAPANLAVEDDENIFIEKDRDLVLTWDVVDNATGYNVYKNDELVGQTTETTYTVPAENVVYNATPITYAVSAKNDAGESEEKSQVSVIVTGYGNINGVVTYGETKVADITILLSGTTAFGEDNYDAITLEDGSFNKDVLEGTYTLTISHEDYEEVEYPNIIVTYNEDIKIDIQLTDKPATFEGTVSTDWNTAANWSTGEVPGAGVDVIINASAVISSDANVNVKNLNIKSGNLTIEGVLAVTGTITNNGNLIINDGAELFQNNEDINATFNMSIISPDQWESNNQNGWQFISSPFVDATVASFIPSEGEYDLYKYDGKQELEWVNHKGGNSDVPGTDAETEFFFDFNDGSMEGLRVFKNSLSQATDWQVTADGDTYYSGHENTKGIYSCSWDNNYVWPYNYVVTENAYSITATSELSWFMRPTDYTYASDDKYQVVASTDGVDFNIILWTGTAASATENILPLAEHAGETLYLGFYHYTEGTAGDAIVLDNIRLSSGSRNQTRGTSSFEETFAQGVGYLASYEKAATVALNGELHPNTSKTWGQYYYNAEKDLANFHLLGNPFSFNMDMSKLNSFGMVNGYAVVNANGEYEYKTDGIVNVGDGFFVKVKENYATLTYDHSYVAPVLRGSAKANNINIIASGKAGKDNVIVNFDGQSEGFNKLQNFNDAIATVYVSENGKHYGIANVDENTTEVALNFNAKEMGNYSISLDVNGEFEEVTLVDRFTGIETNMLLEDEYTFTATSNDNPNRFVIRLDNGQQTTDNGQFVYQSGEELILSIEGSVQIVDMLGRVVYSNEHSNGNNRISVSEFNNAAYVIRVVNEEGVKTQKVVIY